MLINRKDINISNYMIIPQLFNVEEYISKLNDPIVLNRFVGPGYEEKIREACIAKKEDRDIIFSCDCGELEGNFFKGTRCEKCNTFVQDVGIPMNNVIFEIPYGRYVLHPIAYMMLDEISQYSNCVNSVLNTTKPLKKEYVDAGIDQQGWGYLYTNFFRILTIIREKFVPKNKRMRAQSIQDFLYENRNIIWINKIVLSGTLHTRETNGKLNLVDPMIKPILAAVFDMLLCQTKNSVKLSSFEEVLYEMYQKYIKYLVDVCNSRISKKEGYGRGNIYGTSMFFSMRAVINPIVDPHEGDEIHIPWEVAMEMLELHLINKLTKKHGMKTQEAIEFKNNYYLKYSPLIDQCFKELIEDSPHKGIPILINRNPTIKFGSIVLVYITKVDFGSRCMKISDMLLPEMNGDYLYIIQRGVDIVNSL